MTAKYDLPIRFILFAIAFSSGFMAFSQTRQEAKKSIDDLISQMSLEEKIGQMGQVAIEQVGDVDKKAKTFVINEDKLRNVIVKYKIGSILNTPSGVVLTQSQWNDIIHKINKIANTNNPKIPVIYGLDDIHGANFVAGFTSFPQQLGLAATWNKMLVQEAGAVTAYESRAAGVPWGFSPVLDLGINPLWPRLWETFGEDPLLVSEMGAAFIKGAQDPMGSNEKILMSLKHYLGYSDPKYGKDRTNAWIPENYLREYHLPAFAAAVKAGAKNVMVNSSLVNGIPGHINKYLLTDVLKGELGFTGFIVTDWRDIENVAKRDKIAKDNKEALLLCINAGIDMSMIPYNYQEFCDDLASLVKEGKVSQSRIDDAVKRILMVKDDLGLFNPLADVTGYPKFGGAEFAKKAYNTAAESITLLKNHNNILPISKGTRLLVCGPNANSMRALNGGWSYTWQGDRTAEFTNYYKTIYKAVSDKFGAANVTWSTGVAYNENGKYWSDSIVNLDATLKAAAQVDYVLLCIGENSYTETPGNINDLNLSENQLKLAQAIISAGKPIILILNEGRPRIISSIEPFIKAVVQMYLPGNYGAEALADILAGEINPSGKLPVTYPRFANSLTPYIHKPSDEVANPQGAYDYSADFNPQYQFGYGLSYSSFEYQKLKVNKMHVGIQDTVEISTEVKNAGKYDGKEVVQLFIGDEIASLTPDVKRLRGFKKIFLKAGQSTHVTFKIPIKTLAFINPNNKKQLEKGVFSIEIGGEHSSFLLDEDQEF